MKSNQDEDVVTVVLTSLYLQRFQTSNSANSGDVSSGIINSGSGTTGLLFIHIYRRNDIIHFIE